MKSNSIVFLVLCVFIAACGFNKSKSAADKAIKALRRVDAATDIGINQIEYNARVAEAKVEVDSAIPDIEDSQMKIELSEALEAYKDAAHLWSAKPLEHLNLVVILREKYGLPHDVTALDRRANIQLIWKIGREHLNNASQLSSK